MRVLCGGGGRPGALRRRRGQRETVEIALVGEVAAGRRAARPRGHGDRLGGGRPHEVRGRVPRRRARPSARRRDPVAGRAGTPLQADGGVRRPHALDLQVRDRRPAPRERGAGPRPGLPGVRDPDGPGGRRHRDRPPAGRDLHLLRRHDAGARHRTADLLERRPRARTCAWSTRRSTRCGIAKTNPDRDGRLLRHRLRDHRALDGADAQARAGRRRDQLPLHVQPRDDRAAAAGAARLARPAPRRLHRPRARVDGGRRAAVRVHPRRLRQAAGGGRLRAAGRAPVDQDDPRADRRRALRGGEPVHARRSRTRATWPR